MSTQNFMNMISAAIVFVGGMMIVIFYPGQIAGKYRVLIGIFVSLYFMARVVHTILAMRRERRQTRSELRYLADGNKGDQGEAKSA